jgi:hypothetical protein
MPPGRACITQTGQSDCLSIDRAARNREAQYDRVTWQQTGSQRLCRRPMSSNAHLRGRPPPRLCSVTTTEMHRSSAHDLDFRTEEEVADSRELVIHERQQGFGTPRLDLQRSLDSYPA